LKNYHFELHLTLSCNSFLEQERIINLCKNNNIKLIVVQSLKNKNIILTDLMTSMRFFCNQKTIFTYLEENILFFQKNQINVLRSKIESELSFYTDNLTDNFKHYYFESHLPIIIENDSFIQDFDKLSELSVTYHSHLSKNAFKKNQSTTTVMTTLRKNSFEEFEENHFLFTKALKEQFSISKVEKEFVFFDSNLAHDNVWVN
jgi:hypothetical protein